MPESEALSGPLCRVLDEDPSLTQHVSGTEGSRARQRAVTRLVPVGIGPWDPHSALAELGPPAPAGPRGLFVLEGVALRELSAAGGIGSVLVGPGELLWETTPAEQAMLLSRTPRWTALTDLRLAVIDSALMHRLSPWPQVTLALLDRAGRHHQMLALQQSIACQVRVEDRVLMLLLAVAERWGRIVKDGIRIDIPLTVTALAELVAAQRQTVSMIMTRLGRDGRVRRTPSGWMVRGSLAAEFEQARGGRIVPRRWQAHPPDFTSTDPGWLAEFGDWD
jgi:CRP/FNR family cyclic AMP-dependent transcriptional regulator